MELNPKLLSTLSYLSSLLDPQEEVMFSFHKGSVRLANLTNLTIKEVNIPEYCALEDMIDSLMYDMCTDCLKADYNFKNPFFIDLCKAYIHSLIHTFGDEVPITRTLATRIIEHKLHPGQVTARQCDMVVHINSPNSDYLKDKPGQQWHYFLLPNLA